MGNLVLLATEAHGEGGFGLNFNILETNLINLGILLGVLYYFGSKLVGNILSERRSKIEQAIKEVEARQREGAEALADQQQKLAQAQVEAENIRAAAEVNAKAAKEAILAASAQEIERMKESAVQDLNSERERAMAELRQRVATMAMAKVDAQLRDTLDNSAQQQLIDRNIALLGGGS
ncbi:F0F1 ATP synthase subunit B [Moorena sp. SIO3H5]|uniref:F0F1 ATP synthase subunit B n=1 Tax=Moorena sp. SIO3H5 TaxID=2607834 RepID=UPI0013B9DFB2|nr:F0F1 ATP synthase subunit B [Moorena sp. SIO3H5]NEO68539.1 F0F1 ATP synthase subunit B [Moorena sp. SIO3H5]